MPRITFEVLCKDLDEELEFKQYCEDNHFFYDHYNIFTTTHVALFEIVFDKEENAHNKPVILERYLKGKKISYIYNMTKKILKD